MRVILYDETKYAMQDARWCYVPTDHVAADRQQQMAGWVKLQHASDRARIPTKMSKMSYRTDM